jgi:hypothetical protein
LPTERASVTLTFTQGTYTEVFAIAKKRAVGKRISGGHIRSWRKKAFEELPGGSDEEIADRVTALAREEGFDWAATPDQVAKWRAAPPAAKPGRKARQVATVSQGGEGEAIPVLRQLVRLLGKEEVKRLVDAL